MRTKKITTPSGEQFTIITHNTVLNGEGFCISYNDYDTGIYGSDTTALVFGQMEKFYVLNGDHRENYESLISKGFEACLDYFKANTDKMNKYSEKP